jgi:hypothetical protein
VGNLEYIYIIWGAYDCGHAKSLFI